MNDASGRAVDTDAALRLVERFLERLAADPAGDPSDALALLVRELPAYGACLVEWPLSGEPTMLAVAGLIQDVEPDEDLLAFVASALPHPGLHSKIIHGQRPFCVVGHSVADNPLLLLLTWIDLQARPECEPLLRPLPGLIARFMKQSRPVPAAEVRRRPLTFPDGYVPGDSPSMTELYRQMEHLLQGDLPVLIVGETGVGKESVARTLHTSSNRHAGPFVAVNCAAIPADLLEAEMFGIGKGVATGVSERSGKFQLAQHGTLFLDEIGEMPRDLQAKLLRALQEKEIHPVGGAPLKVDIRVVAATNTDLLKSMEAGRFRRDLYYRIAGFVLRVPTLIERQGHIPRLVEDFIRVFEKEALKRLRGISLRALRALAEYSWPGNVRELEHEVRRLVYVCPEGEVIDLEMLSEHVRLQKPAATGDFVAGAAEDVARLENLSLEDNLSRLERQLISEALRRCSGNRTQAAKILGISRNGLAIKMERLGLAPAVAE
jgi:DNA-binding NtrC family response regulator